MLEYNEAGWKAWECYENNEDKGEPRATFPNLKYSEGLTGHALWPSLRDHELFRQRSLPDIHRNDHSAGLRHQRRDSDASRCKQWH